MTRVAVLLVAVAVALPAQAGQIMIEQYGFQEIAGEGGSAYVGKVVSTKPAGPRSVELVLSLTAIFTTPPGKDAQPPGFGKKPRRPGDRLTVRTYPGVEQRDAGHSVRDRRLHGEPAKAAVGDLVVVIAAGPGRPIGVGDAFDSLGEPPQVEVRDADPAMMRKLALVFDPTRRAAYPRDPIEAVRKDLADPDLAPLAAAELEKRKALDAAALIRAEPGFLRARFAKLPERKRAELALQLVALVEKDAALREPVEALLLRELDAVAVPAIARLVARYDRKKPEDAETLEQLRDELLALEEDRGKKRLDLTPLADYVALQEVWRPAHRDMQGLARLTGRMAKPARTRVAVLLLQNAWTKVEKRDDGPDLDLLVEAARLAKEAPAPAVLDELAKLDPTVPRITQTKESVLGSMIDLALVLAKGAPATKPRARAIIDGWLAKGATTDAETLRRWKAAR